MLNWQNSIDWVARCSHVSGYLSWKRNRCPGITFRVKCRGQLIVRLKAIKSREDTFCYLSSYLHCSFLWHLVIVTFVHCIIKLSSQMRRPLVVFLRHWIVCCHRIICSHQTMEALKCYLFCMLLIRCLLAVVVIVIVIVLVIIIWFGNCSNDCSCYTIWLTLLKFERPKT